MEIGQTLDLMPDRRVSDILMVSGHIGNVKLSYIDKKTPTAFCNDKQKHFLQNMHLFFNKQVVKMHELI